MRPKTNRTRGGRRWTPDDDARLTALAREGHDPIILASVLKRSFSSIQHRLRRLRPIQRAETVTFSKPVSAKSIPKIHQRDAILACGPMSPAGRKLVEALWIAIKAILDREEPSRLSPSVESIIGAIVRDALISSKEGQPWSRIAVSSFRATQTGVDQGALRNLLRALGQDGFLDEFVGYFGFESILRLSRDAAKLGRPTVLRASSKLINWSKRHGITQDDAFLHFPVEKSL